jgi:hypothetical protein
MEQILEMLEGGRVVEPERDIRNVVKIAIGFERGDHHPIEWERGKNDEECDRSKERDLPDNLGDDALHVRSPAAG